MWQRAQKQLLCLVIFVEGFFFCFICTWNYLPLKKMFLFLFSYYWATGNTTRLIIWTHLTVICNKPPVRFNHSPAEGEFQPTLTPGYGSVKSVWKCLKPAIFLLWLVAQTFVGKELYVQWLNTKWCSFSTLWEVISPLLSCTYVTEIQECWFLVTSWAYTVPISLTIWNQNLKHL